jgi:TRAP-type mannitol/chloroaromatic compound transport system substrate-binding protein
MALEKMSNGRFEVTPSAPGAICPVDEQAEAVSSGLTPIMMPAGTYYGGKIPVTNVYGVGIGLPEYRDFVMAYEFYKDGRAQELVFEAYEEVFNVVVVGDTLGPQNILLGSNKPIDSLADIDGQKLRCGDEAIAAPLTEFGASTTWIPASEVYTALATGVFDGFTMGNAADDYALAFHEVTKYWLKSPGLMVLYEDPFLVNRDVWNEMPADLQEMVLVAADYADSVSQWEAELGILEAWKAVTDYGIIPVTWSAEDTDKYMASQLKWAEAIAEKDANTAELLQICREYREYAGL